MVAAAVADPFSRDTLGAALKSLSFSLFFSGHIGEINEVPR